MQSSWRRILGAACVVLLMMAGIASAQSEKTDEKPGFRVEKTAIDLGTIVAGTDVVATFIFHNDTDKEVKILKAKPS